jgi:hypothetical protein
LSVYLVACSILSCQYFLFLVKFFPPWIIHLHIDLTYVTHVLHGMQIIQHTTNGSMCIKIYNTTCKCTIHVFNQTHNRRT